MFFFGKKNDRPARVSLNSTPCVCVINIKNLTPAMCLIRIDIFFTVFTFFFSRTTFPGANSVYSIISYQVLLYVHTRGDPNDTTANFVVLQFTFFGSSSKKFYCVIEK